MDELRLSGFKCFADSRLDLNQVTILTGNNGSGKSSVIQALLLLRESVERCSKFVEERNALEWDEATISLNDYRRLQLGRYDDICHVSADGICIGINGVDFYLEEDEADAGWSCVKVDKQRVASLPVYLTQKEFYYLNAERIGPRIQSEVRRTDYPQSGDCGELAGNSNLGLNPEDVNIYFFQSAKEECNYLPITIDSDGNLSDFPVDFFDQVRQDMLEIIRLAAERKKESYG